MGRWGAAELECLSAGCLQVVGDGEAALGVQDSSPKRLHVLDSALGVLRVKVRVRWKRKMLGEGGTMVWLQLPEKGR